MATKPTIDLIGKTAYAYVNGVISAGKIVAHRPLREPRPPGVSMHEAVDVKLNAATLAFNRLDVVVALEGNDVPKVWQDVLVLNEDNDRIGDIGVCLEPFAPYHRTTLFDKRTLNTLSSVITERSSAKIYLFNGDDSISEGKTTTEDSCTSYSIGDIDIELPDEISRYQ